jgi:hypothetical protein
MSIEDVDRTTPGGGAVPVGAPAGPSGAGVSASFPSSLSAAARRAPPTIVRDARSAASCRRRRTDRRPSRRRAVAVRAGEEVAGALPSSHDAGRRPPCAWTSSGPQGGSPLARLGGLLLSKPPVPCGPLACLGEPAATRGRQRAPMRWCGHWGPGSSLVLACGHYGKAPVHDQQVSLDGDCLGRLSRGRPGRACVAGSTRSLGVRLTLPRRPPRNPCHDLEAVQCSSPGDAAPHRLAAAGLSSMGRSGRIRTARPADHSPSKRGWQIAPCAGARSAASAGPRSRGILAPTAAGFEPLGLAPLLYTSGPLLAAVRQVLARARRPSGLSRVDM